MNCIETAAKSAEKLTKLTPELTRSPSKAAAMFYGTQEKCATCGKTAYPLEKANVTKGNHMMWTMGDDFQYQNAESWFKQMDKLIHYVSKDGRLNALYSTLMLKMQKISHGH